MPEDDLLFLEEEAVEVVAAAVVEAEEDFFFFFFDFDTGWGAGASLRFLASFKHFTYRG